MTRFVVELLDLRMLKVTIMGTPDRASLERDAVADLSEYCAGTDDNPGMDARTTKHLKAGGYTDAEIVRLDERLLDDRNRAWIPKLEVLLAKGGVFVVVGADHLIGARGVIATLAAKGYKTSRIAP